MVTVDPGPSGTLPPPQGSAGTGNGDPKAKMPPLDTPSGINKQATERFGWLKEQVIRVHSQIDQVEKDLPRDCPIVDKACDARWQAIAKSLLQIEERAPRSPVCPGTSVGAKLYEKRVAEHQAYIAKRREDISAALRELVAPHGEAGKQAWEAHMTAARQAFPRVCLNYSCRDW